MNAKCVICGKDFTKTNNVNKYCSKQCKLTASNTQKAEWRFIHPKSVKKKEPVTVLCRICGKPVEPVQGAFRISRPRLHEECIINDIRHSVLLGDRLSKTQLSRIERLGITVEELKENR